MTVLTAENYNKAPQDRFVRLQDGIHFESGLYLDELAIDKGAAIDKNSGKPQVLDAGRLVRYDGGLLMAIDTSIGVTYINGHTERTVTDEILADLHRKSKEL